MTERHYLNIELSESDTPDIIRALHIKLRETPGIGTIECPEAVNVCTGMCVFLRYIKNARTTSAMTSFKMVVFLLRLATGKNDHLPVIRAAWPGRYLRAIGLSCPFCSVCLAGVMTMVTARTRFLVMFRMNIIACRASYDRSHITFPASAACVHIKAYDTQ